MKYFIMTEEGRKGPYPLEELVQVGVRPSTYVWCKEMSDWDKAANVPEICRLFRRHLAGVLPSGGNADTDDMSPVTSDASERQNRTPDPLPRFRGFIDNPGQLEDLDFTGQKIDYSRPPANLLPLAIFSMLFCFPLTGIIAIYFSWKTRSQWKATYDPDLSSERVAQYQRRAHDYSRLSRMWIGYTFCAAIIFFGILLFAR